MEAHLLELHLKVVGCDIFPLESSKSGASLYSTNVSFFVRLTRDGTTVELQWNVMELLEAG